MAGLLFLIGFGQPSRAFDLGPGLEAAFAAGANPVHGIGSRRDEAGLGAPGDDELAGASAAGDTVNDHGLVGGVVLVHELKEVLDLFVSGHSVVGDVNEVIVKPFGNILAIVELADIDHGLDALVVKEVEHVGVRPPGGGDDSFHDPGEGFGSLRLSALWPIPRSNGHGGLWQLWNAKQFRTGEWMATARTLFHLFPACSGVFISQVSLIKMGTDYVPLAR